MPKENYEVNRIEDKLLCYNRGCGQEFFKHENKEDSCTYHPGTPYFHDAYKSWTCCNRKCTDFTEFLNFKGCTKGFHNNVKPPEPEKPSVDQSLLNEMNEKSTLRAPVAKPMERPSFDTPLIKLVPSVSSALEQQVAALVTGRSKEMAGEVEIGTSCKNGGCKATYGGEDTPSECLHHPGGPIFHEGLKFWTCCQRRTTDFQAFLNQEGCKTGSHVWVKERHLQLTALCRMDWHQTASNVVVSVFAKKYDPKRSTVQLSPVRLYVELFFPEEDSCYNLDVELRGVVDVSQCSAQMLPTKVEVKMKKAEPGSWSKLDIPRAPKEPVAKRREPSIENLSLADLEPVDLSDL